jgi:hypothetical protein
VANDSYEIPAGGNLYAGLGPGSPPPAPSFALTGPSTAVAGASQDYTLTGSNLVVGQSYVGSLVSGDVGMVDTPSEVTLTSVSPAAVVGVLFAAVGTQSLKGVMTGGAESNQLAVDVSPAPSPPPPPPPPAATQLALSISPSTGTTGSTTATVSVTPNGPIPAGGGTATLGLSGGGTLGATTLNFTAGSIAAQSTTLTRSSDGTSTVTLTNSMGLSNSPSTATYTSSAAPAPPPPSGTITGPAITASVTASRSWAMGHAFRQGDLPSGSDLDGLQTTVMSTWPDGSARMAVVAGTTSFTSGTPASIAMAIGTAASGTTINAATLTSRAPTVVFDAGAFGSATFNSSDWGSPFQTVATGPVMAQLVYRKAIGADAHLVAWLEVRVYADGATEFLPWVENGYLLVASPTNKSATYALTINGSSVFSAAIDLLNHQRTPLISGTALSYWIGLSDPGIVVKHDAAYLQATRLVPSYRATVSPSASAVTGLPSSFAPLQQGGFPGGMGAGGYHASIGLLPDWDVLYLTTTASSVWAAVQRNAYSAGRYGIHFRDESTNRPVDFTDHPTLVLDGSSGVSGTGASSTSSYTPTATGGAVTYASSHAPAMGYMAYLLTGRFYHLETVQFQAAVHYLKNSDTNREGADGIMRTDVGANTTRGAAWALRTLAQAAVITPDADALKAPLMASLVANIDWNHAKYVAQPNNPQGWMHPYSDYGVTGQFFESTWMQDFMTAALGYLKAVQPTLSAAEQVRMDELFDWKAKSVTGRLGSIGAGDYLYRDACPFVVSVAPSDSPDFNTGTGPWHPNWGEVWTACQAETATGAKELGTTLRGGNIPDATSYWGNFMPALAYAVEHGAQGAAAGFLRLTSATNWSTLQTGFNTAPVWGVKPPTDPALPSWLPSAGEWAALSSSTLNTSGAGWSGTSPGGTGTYETIVTAWGGGVVNTKGVWRDGAFVRGTFLVLFGGGHGDYAGNELYAFGPLEDDAPTWSRINDPTIPAPTNVTRSGTYPVSRHTYDTLVYLPEQNKMACIGAPGYYSVGSAFNSGDIFSFDVDPSSATPWASLDTGFPAFNGGGTGTIDLLSWYDPTTGKAWGIGKGNSQRIGAYDPVAGSWTSWAIDNPNGPNGKGKAGFSPGDGLAAFLTDAGAVRVCDVRSSPAMFTPTVTGTGPGTACSMEWDEENGRFVAWSGTGSTLYFLTPGADPYSGGDSWAWTSVTPGSGATPATQVSNGTYGRMRMVELGSARGVLLMPAHNQPVYFYRF